MWRASSIFLLVMIFMTRFGAAQDRSLPIHVRVQNFTVNPSSGPVANIKVTNLHEGSFVGRLRATFPEGWTTTQKEHVFNLKSGETKTLPFAIEKARDIDENRYVVKVTVESGQKSWNLSQKVFCASAPYFKPVIDGNLDEWKDSIPMTFGTKGRQTIVRGYWNRRNLCLAVEVEEKALQPISGGKVSDAVQFSLADLDAVTPMKLDGLSQRNEVLVVPEGNDRGSCYTLIKPGESMKFTQIVRPLASLRIEKASVAVRRKEGRTAYELSIPFKSIPPIRGVAGREICFSLLVHDSEGAGVRDLGSVMNLPGTVRSSLAWSRFSGMADHKITPYDNKIEFGFCSSIH
ncbi:MAG: hypothetical protein CMN05_14905 [Roseibacillus sp.]|jgi:hypothetical protein|nr:hypothetical protein [Roseibacillus sp.]MCP4728459.1 hypothetical protein [Roseibacillus sp.]HJM65288.1 hypothetical protein [Roseibacillus sp.]|tara:strand:+ start:1473 stop:2513 length:1041 start_codon:yes stop_codon:yes gene_type:complete